MISNYYYIVTRKKKAKKVHGVSEIARFISVISGNSYLCLATLIKFVYVISKLLIQFETVCKHSTMFLVHVRNLIIALKIIQHLNSVVE